MPTARRLFTSALQRSPLPKGAPAVGVGLLVMGATAYGFLVVAARALGPEGYASLSVLWALVFLVGPGFFMPLEQEVSRALATRRSQGLGPGPLLRRATLLGTVLLAALLVTGFVVRPLLGHLLDDNLVLLASLLLAMAGYFTMHLARGAFSGLGRFRSYSICLGAEGVLRLVACVGLALAGVDSAGPYGLALGLAPFAAVAITLRGERDLGGAGPGAPWSEISSSLGWLLAASVLAQFLLHGGPLAVKLLASPGEEAVAGRFLASLIVARVPLFMFLAVQAALLPALAALAGGGHFDEFRQGLRRLMFVVGGVGAAATVGALAIGPPVVQVLFGSELALGRRDLVLLTAGSAAFMVAMALAQALIAVSAPARVALAWLVGAACFVVVTASGQDLLLRTELGLLLGSLSAAVSMSVQIPAALRASKTPVPALDVAAAWPG